MYRIADGRVLYLTGLLGKTELTGWLGYTELGELCLSWHLIDPCFGSEINLIRGRKEHFDITEEPMGIFPELKKF